MHYRTTLSAGGHRTAPAEERSLSEVTFIGSFPAADFHLTPERPEVALVGRSNVGKSSLVNALTGRRAIARTSRTPGKTRAANVYGVDGRFYLVDLPGYGYARVSKTERKEFAQLVKKTLADRRHLKGVVWLLDIRHDPSADDRQIADVLEATALPVLAAITKADKIGRGLRPARLAAIRVGLGLTEDQCVLTSATTKEGIGELWRGIEALL